MARYFAEVVGGAVSRVVVFDDQSTASDAVTLLGGTWQEVLNPGRYGAARIGQTANEVPPPSGAIVTNFPETPTKIVDSANYDAWPWDLLNWDPSRSKLWFCYMDADDHITGAASVVFNTIDTSTDQAGTPVVAVSSETHKCVTHSSCVATNGDYLLWVMYRDKSTGATVSASVWRSTDGGANWSEEGDMVDGSDVSVGCLKPHGAFVTSAGTIIVSDRTDAGSGSPYIHRSTDNGVTWSSEIAVPNDITGSDPLEPCFWQHPTSGRIVGVYRAGETGSSPRALFSYSDDDGLTWSSMAQAPEWWQQYSNPAAIVYHADTDSVECFVGHRRYNNVAARLFRVAATTDDAADLTFGDKDLLYGGTSTNNDFGYPTAARVGSKVYLMWFDGGDVDADIYMAVGTRPA